jgi:hypothetical protein
LENVSRIITEQLKAVMKTHPFEKKITKLFNQYLKPIVSKANFQDSRYFQTAMFHMQDEMGRKAKDVEPHQVEDFLLDLLRSLKQIEIEELLNRASDQLEDSKRQLETDSEQGRAFVELMEEAEERAQFISFIILNRLSLPDLIRGIVEPEHLFKDYRRERVGEHRARIAMNIIGSVVENLYKHYVKMVWELWRVSQGDVEINSMDSYAFIIEKKLKKQLPPKFQFLVHEHASLLRNAAQHYSYWYEPKKDLIVVVQDNGKPPITIKVHQVYKMAKEMYKLSGTYCYHAIQLCTMRIFVNEAILRPFFEALKMADFNTLEDLGEVDFTELDKQAGQLFQPIKPYTFARMKQQKGTI